MKCTEYSAQVSVGSGVGTGGPVGAQSNAQSKVQDRNRESGKHVKRLPHMFDAAGGTAIMSFSNRYFPTKAIQLWTQTGEGCRWQATDINACTVALVVYLKFMAEDITGPSTLVLRLH